MYHKVVSSLGFESFVVTPQAAGACHDVESLEKKVFVAWPDPISSSVPDVLVRHY